MKARILLVSILLTMATAKISLADAIPYPNAGTPNPVTYTFTAMGTGTVDVFAYFAGSTATFDNQLGLQVGGSLVPIIAYSNAGVGDNSKIAGAQPGYGLDNHLSTAGDSIEWAVQGGSTLTFVLHNLTLGVNAYSDPSLNAAYDNYYSSYTGSHEHVYSTAYTATSPIIDHIPDGTFVSFEDLPGSNPPDWNYNDEDFVFTNVAMTSAGPTLTPIPSSFYGGLGLIALALLWRIIPTPWRGFRSV